MGHTKSHQIKNKDKNKINMIVLFVFFFKNSSTSSSLVATNAARFRHAAGGDKLLLEFGLRRAQGPDGGLSASKYCYLGGKSNFASLFER